MTINSRFIWLSFGLIFSGLSVMNAECDFKTWRYDDLGSVAANAGYTLVPTADVTNTMLLNFLASTGDTVQLLGSWNPGYNCFYYGTMYPTCYLASSDTLCSSYYPKWIAGRTHTICKFHAASLADGLSKIAARGDNGIRDASMALYTNCNYNDPCKDVVCSDSGNKCRENICVDGECVLNNLSPGHSCSDDNKCNGDEACDGAGVCQSGIEIICEDNNICTDNECDAETGNCIYPAVQGRLCGASDACNGEEICDATGDCINGEPIICPFGEKCESSQGDCVMDCTVFDIDEYNSQCSVIINSQWQDMFDAVNKRIDNLRIIDGRNEQESSPILSFDIFNKDFFLIALLIVNIILLFYICCFKIARNKSYKPIYVNYQDEEK